MRSGFDPCTGKIPWRRAWQRTPIFLPEEYHGQRNLAGDSQQSHKESDTTEMTWHACMTFSPSHMSYEGFFFSSQSLCAEFDYVHLFFSLL